MPTKLDVDTGGRLVKNEHLRCVHHCLRHQQSSPHSAGKAARVGVRLSSEADRLRFENEMLRDEVDEARTEHRRILDLLDERLPEHAENGEHQSHKGRWLLFLIAVLALAIVAFDSPRPSLTISDEAPAARAPVGVWRSTSWARAASPSIPLRMSVTPQAR